MLRAVGLNLAVFCALFLLHIVFAAAGIDAMFRIVAFLISIQTIGFAPLTALLVGPCEASVRRTVAMRSLTVGVPMMCILLPVLLCASHQVRSCACM